MVLWKQQTYQMEFPSKSFAIGGINGKMDFSPFKSQLAKVVDMLPGPDDVVLVAMVMTQNRAYKRPITKLID